MEMNDGYDLFCIQKMREKPSENQDTYEIDDVTCACAHYLNTEGYTVPLDKLTHQQLLTSASQLIPTTTNQNRSTS